MCLIIQTTAIQNIPFVASSTRRDTELAQMMKYLAAHQSRAAAPVRQSGWSQWHLKVISGTDAERHKE